MLGARGPAPRQVALIGQSRGVAQLRVEKGERPISAGAAMAVTVGIGTPLGVAFDNIAAGVITGAVVGFGLVALDKHGGSPHPIAETRPGDRGCRRPGRSCARPPSSESCPRRLGTRSKLCL